MSLRISFSLSRIKKKLLAKVFNHELKEYRHVIVCDGWKNKRRPARDRRQRIF